MLKKPCNTYRGCKRLFAFVHIEPYHEVFLPLGSRKKWYAWPSPPDCNCATASCELPAQNHPNHPKSQMFSSSGMVPKIIGTPGTSQKSTRNPHWHPTETPTFHPNSPESSSRTPGKLGSTAPRIFRILTIQAAPGENAENADLLSFHTKKRVLGSLLRENRKMRWQKRGKCGWLASRWLALVVEMVEG